MERKFSSKFSPEEYAETSYSNSFSDSSPKWFLIQKIDIFCSEQAKSHRKETKVLDYGCGPAPVLSAALSPLASEITMVAFEEYHRDFLDRDFLDKWLKKSPDSYNWSSYMQHMADLHGGIEGEELEENLRRKITEVVACDITKEKIIAKGHEGPYDIVFNSLCLENPCQNLMEYRESMKKFSFSCEE